MLSVPLPIWRLLRPAPPQISVSAAPPDQVGFRESAKKRPRC
jgi:hypothetical protein